MLNRYELHFKQMVWQNIRRSLKQKGTASIWYRLLYALFKIFNNQIIEIINYLYNQIFIKYADFSVLKKRAELYSIYPKPGEDTEIFRNRFISYRNLSFIPVSTFLLKTVLAMNLDIAVDDIYIRQGYDYQHAIFTIGVTPLGAGLCVSSTFFRWCWEAYIPDLSGEDIDREYIKAFIENFNIPSNEFFIYEERPEGLYEW